MGSAWFSGEEVVNGRIAPGQFADIAVLSDDDTSVAADDISDIESVLTIVGGNVSYGAQEFEGLAPELPAISPEWSPITLFGGYVQ